MDSNVKVLGRWVMKLWHPIGEGCERLMGSFSHGIPQSCPPSITV